MANESKECLLQDIILSIQAKKMENLMKELYVVEQDVVHALERIEAEQNDSYYDIWHFEIDRKAISKQILICRFEDFFRIWEMLTTKSIEKSVRFILRQDGNERYWMVVEDKELLLSVYERLSKLRKSAFYQKLVKKPGYRYTTGYESDIKETLKRMKTAIGQAIAMDGSLFMLIQRF